MGHSLLGTLPRTKEWKDVVRLVADGADVAQVAGKTLVAAQKALGTTKADAGFGEAIYLLSQIALAGKTKDAAAHLESLGVEIHKDYSTADLTTALSVAVNRRMEARGLRTDWGEMARGALVSAITSKLAENGERLFTGSRQLFNAELGGLHREKEFGALGRTFFGKMTKRFLNYFLTKTLGTQIGEERGFPTRREYREFRKSMRTHCEEAAKIVEKFSGQWLNKQLREHGGVTREAAERFGAHAIRKMQLELAARAGRYAN